MQRTWKCQGHVLVTSWSSFVAPLVLRSDARDDLHALLALEIFKGTSRHSQSLQTVEVLLVCLSAKVFVDQVGAKWAATQNCVVLSPSGKQLELNWLNETRRFVSCFAVSSGWAIGGKIVGFVFFFFFVFVFISLFKKFFLVW